MNVMHRSNDTWIFGSILERPGYQFRKVRGFWTFEIPSSSPNSIVLSFFHTKFAFHLGAFRNVFYARFVNACTCSHKLEFSTDDILHVRQWNFSTTELQPLFMFSCEFLKLIYIYFRWNNLIIIQQALNIE